jgi:hypothetical protein
MTTEEAKIDELRGLERLTERNPAWAYHGIPMTAKLRWWIDTKNDTKYFLGEAADRLALYESTVPDLLAELDRLTKEAERSVVLPCSIGDTVYNLCKCDDIGTRLDGTMYSEDGSPGTATGYYCPYLDTDECPHDTDDCDKVKNKIAIFEDWVVGISIGEDETWVNFDKTPGVYASDFGKTVFLTRAEAEAALGG